MPGRVIQGFFPAGGPRPLPGSRIAAPVQAKRGGLAAPTVPGAPRPAFTSGAVAQRAGGEGHFAVDAVQIGLARSGGAPLPEALLAKMEAAFGADFSAVRVHIGPQAARIGAIAFTTGNDLYFAPGRYQPNSAQGQQLIGHELAHVIQQRQGRVRVPGGGVAVVQDHALEAEADRLGMRAAMHQAPFRPARPAAPNTQTRRAVQRYQGQLLSQQGPSCWLFVSEALADMRGLDTWLLVALMHLYPGGDMQNDSRARRLELVRNTLRAARLSLHHRAQHGGMATFTKRQISEALRRGCGGNADYTAATEHLFPQPGVYAVADVKGLLRRATKLAEALRAALTAGEHTPAVLGGAATEIDGNSALADIGLTLVHVGGGQAYLSVGDRPRLGTLAAHYNAGTDTYDLTALGNAAIGAGRAHALLLVGTNTHTQRLTYKDPNYGNSSVIITYAQLREMARRNGTVSVRALLNGSVLHNTLGPPVPRPQPVPPPPPVAPWVAAPVAPVAPIIPVVAAPAIVAPVVPVVAGPVAPLIAGPMAPVAANNDWRMEAAGVAAGALLVAFIGYLAAQEYA